MYMYGMMTGKKSIQIVNSKYDESCVYVDHSFFSALLAHLCQTHHTSSILSTNIILQPGYLKNIQTIVSHHRL
jgi:hypothetical protein